MSTHTRTILSISSIQEPAAQCAVDKTATVLRVQLRVSVVGEAANGVEALERVAELSPDLVLMDVQMPRMNGISAARIIARNYPEATVVLMSGDDSPELRAQAEACGAHTFIHKPKFAAEIASVLSSGERATVHAGA
jgi:DNA-binding NarL/FixJ family response regulator